MLPLQSKILDTVSLLRPNASQNRYQRETIVGQPQTSFQTAAEVYDYYSFLSSRYQNLGGPFDF